MKSILVLSIVVALLAGCAVAPAGYGDSRDGYYRERGYNRGDGYYRDYSYRGGHANQGDPFRDRGG